ncbi:hypothetical protein SO802_014621 [Lithocarpus litseifolius]|uniref:Zinc knuckle CX2CX4HX4C domain-containing protein n=1 Tax=Lithocarpus litseifolius TaxID=425828 RepID=A0AAW2CRF9_9ROSI
MAEDSVDTITSQAAKLNWLKSKINLEVVPSSSANSKKLLTDPWPSPQSKDNVLKIGSIAGRALDTDLVGPGLGIWSRCVRVQVEMDISCPLVPGFPLERDHLPVLWIPFKFEKLGNFCFGCGMLGHDHRSCQDKGA